MVARGKYSTHREAMAERTLHHSQRKHIMGRDRRKMATTSECENAVSDRTMNNPEPTQLIEVRPRYPLTDESVMQCQFCLRRTIWIEARLRKVWTGKCGNCQGGTLLPISLPKQ